MRIKIKSQLQVRDRHAHMHTLVIIAAIKDKKEKREIERNVREVACFNEMNAVDLVDYYKHFRSYVAVVVY